MAETMEVIKRDGRKEPVDFGKVHARIKSHSNGLSINATYVAQQVLGRIIDGIKTSELDEITAKFAESLSTTHPDYGVLAARIAISNHQKCTASTFLEAMEQVAAIKDRRGLDANLLAEDFLTVLRTHAELIESKIVYDRDFLFDYFGFKTLEKAYLLQDKLAGRVIERPQHLWMRVAVGIWGFNLEKAFHTYELLSTKQYTHATPTLFNAGTKRPQLSSCFLLSMSADSIKGIYKTLEDCALISQYGGGIGVHCHNIRAAGSLIRGTGGTSNGILPMLRVFNNTARYVDQCFTADTPIHTSAGIKRIIDVNPGDEVLTSGVSEEVDEHGKHPIGPIKPRYCKVQRRVEHDYTGVILDVCVRYKGIVSITTVTPSHPVLTNSDYTPIGDLKVGDKIAMPNHDFGTITAIFNKSFTGTLYDLEVEDVHDYLVEGFGIVHNGGGKRNGSFAFYLEPWHADVEAFLDMKKNTGAEEERARDLFYALWIPDLFMERVDSNGSWTLMCPDECPGLADAVGPAFKALYEKYEAEGRGRKTIPAQTLWFKILDSQIETGTPYLVYKDAANLKSNQQNLGTIKSSNLCSEVIEYSSPEETAVCNLASMNLPAYVKDGVFEFKRFRSVVKHVVESLNKVIDINFYPIPEGKFSNMRHRPIGIGVQGLADVFALLRIPWESPEAAALNKKIFAHMYYAAVESSMDCAIAEGVYETYKGSPASMGKLQFSLWGQEPLADPELDWDLLLHMIEKIGLRNSLLIAPMPTASTAQILGNTESIEPVQQNLFTRRTLAGEFFMVNRHLIHALVKLGVWTPELKDKIVARNGSVQGLAEVPADLQAVFKTVWELKMKTIIDLAADRAPYICQSQSLNLFISDPTYAKLTSMHFYAWRKGLKTGIYYLRTRAAVGAQKFTVDPSTTAAVPKVEEKECTMCSS
jgi:ribonucleoside-diphosphate reductase alpha subunit